MKNILALIPLIFLLGCAPDFPEISGGKFIKEISFENNMGADTTKGDTRVYIFENIEKAEEGLMKLGYKQTLKSGSGITIMVNTYGRDGKEENLKRNEWNMVYRIYYAALGVPRDEMNFDEVHKLFYGKVSFDKTSLCSKSIILVQERIFVDSPTAK